MNIRFEWDEAKRRRNITEHGLDFFDAPEVFAGRTVTFVDDRFDYGERRMITLGLLRGNPVSIIHTETRTFIRLISFRKGTRREREIFYASI
jgi:hypothetical protein